MMDSNRMTWSRRNWTRLAALGGLVSVAAGAFGAHGAADPRTGELLRTGALYGFVHCLATLACAALAGGGTKRPGLAPAFFLAGAALFCGSLYALAFGAPDWVGAITPVGGLLFMAGWAALAWTAPRLEL